MKLIGLKRYHSGGIYYVYHRATNIRLPAHLPENDPAFLAAYTTACGGAMARPAEPEVIAPNTVADELQFWNGCRISDTVGLGPKNEDDDGWMVFFQKKTGDEVFVPFNRALPDFAIPEDLDHLKSAIAAMGRTSETFMRTHYGNPRSAKGAASWFSRAAREAKLNDGLTSHGLRKSRMILHAERGASTKQIAAWSGHETIKEVERYVRRADKKRLLTPSALETGKFL